MTQLKNLDFLYDQFFFKESYADSYFQQCALNRHVDNEDKGTVVIHDTATCWSCCPMSSRRSSTGSTPFEPSSRGGHRQARTIRRPTSPTSPA